LPLRTQDQLPSGYHNDGASPLRPDKQYSAIQPVML